MTDLIARLRNLRTKAASINATLIDDLSPFYGQKKPVFRRLPIGSDEEGNVTTTCSCLMSLATARKLIPSFIKIKKLKADAEDIARDQITAVFRHAVGSRWTSSGLPDLNAFSALIVLRAAGVLTRCPEAPLKELALAMTHPKDGGADIPITAKTNHTLKEIAKQIFIKDVPDSFRVSNFPATPAIGYWFVDAIDRLQLTSTVGEKKWNSITQWVSKEFARQLALVTSEHAAMMDPVAMAAAACLCTRLRRLLSEQDVVPSEKRDELMLEMPTRIEVERAILKAFEKQQDSGIWPKYFPLFNYGGQDEAGSNYFFSFELLEIVVGEFEKSDLLEDLSVLKGIEQALAWCDSNRLEYKVGETTFKGWNSGGQIMTLKEGKPESWATAVVHMFLTKLRSALSYSIRKQILAKYEATPPELVKKSDTDWEKQLDSPLKLIGEEDATSVIKLVEDEIVSYVDDSSNDDPDHKMGHRRSALLFGPPGTSKTSIVRALATRIGWALVELNPSDFLKQGLENIYSQTNEIFNDLSDLWRVVVFFDEMDALAQKRAEGIDVVRQFLTTSMLPKLSRLHDDSRVIFFMATNHQRNFDDAIKRPGRFDLLLCMGPPPWNEKLKHLEEFWPKGESKRGLDSVRNKLSGFVPDNHELIPTLNLFTFSEFKSFLDSIRSGGSLRQAIELMQDSQFTAKVKDWGEKRITLRPQTEQTPTGELSLLDEYNLVDKNASLRQ